MCNEYRNRLGYDPMRDDLARLSMNLAWADGQASNLEPRDSIRIGDTAPIVRSTADDGAELAMVKWAWKGPHGKPVFNLRSDGRDFSRSDRVLIPADGFYEFTAPTDPGQKLKTKWLFTMKGEPWFWIAGIVKEGAFAMLTCPPGPDIAPYHDRQICLLRRDQALAWLDPSSDNGRFLNPLPVGSLTVERVR